MSLTLYFHPLSSFCQKALVALYENATPFTPHLVNLMDAGERAAFRKIWPIGKFPVLRDDKRKCTVPESSVVIEYLDQHYPGACRFVPADGDMARDVRLSDRFFDLYVNMPMQKVVTDRLRPEGSNDRHGVEEAMTRLETAITMIENDMGGKTWAVGETFTMADCAAAPALFYADKVMPLATKYPNTRRYLDRLMQRPSYARALDEAAPYMKMMPR